MQRYHATSARSSLFKDGRSQRVRTLPYRLTWPEIVRLYRLALDTPVHNTQHLPHYEHQHG
jgi:hypothetical protein